ncbi:hypothetical protein [Neorhizobium petrolearium]|uniref:Uncharacterized protein n=1 Tax=Neorhizobium petrolearium TaxID=515361 RepID=A0ABY8M4E5_9HYPH|nr:hypothetical protein [Neorhizobium petrolearium]MCC2609169.1 hypothetical protein [Neorhizobium petrolearium]WGI69397.1 hypothetical protein QEO92_04755 [Neorhizobium petrolearium]
MSTEIPAKKTETKQDITPPYRPLALKAAVAAALMLKRRPKLNPTG